MTWHDLAELRGRGQRPALRMFVTTAPEFARRMTWLGCAAVLHEAGEPMPVELLHGLDVILDLGNCLRAGKVKRLMDVRAVTPARLQTWCRCQKALRIDAPNCLEDERWLAA